MRNLITLFTTLWCALWLVPADAAITFALRGDSVNARYSSSGANPGYSKFLGGTDPAPAAFGHASVFGGQAIRLNAATYNGTKILQYVGRNNFSANQAFTILFRWVPDFTGAPSQLVGFFELLGGGNTGTPGIQAYWSNSDNAFHVGVVNSQGQTCFNLTSAAHTSFTQGQAQEFMISWDGTTSANAVKFSIDGVESATATASNPWISGTNLTLNAMGFGGQRNTFDNIGSPYAVNEIVIYDTAENHVYSARTDFITVSAFDGQSNSGISDSVVKTGTAYVVAGVASTGTYDGSDRWTCPIAGNLIQGAPDLKCNSTSTNLVGTYVPTIAGTTKIGTAFGAAGALTGTYDGSDRWTCPAAGDLIFGSSDLKCNATSTNLAGTYVTVATNAVKTGTTYGALSALTGTYTGSDRWTCPTAPQLLAGVTLKCDSLTTNLTGTLAQQTYGELLVDVITNSSATAPASGTLTKCDGPMDVQLTFQQGGTAKSIAGSTFSAALLKHDGTRLTKSNAAFSIIESGGSNTGRVNMTLTSTDTCSLRAMRSAPVYVVQTSGGQSLTYYGRITEIRERSLGFYP